MTKRLSHVATVCLLLVGAPAAAQVAPLFAPLDLPAPTPYRSAAGAPGEAYWQQRADYSIDAALDPATHRVEGTMRIRYTNNSPHALTYLWLQLDQNLFATDSRGALLHGADSRWRGAFDDGGFTLSNVSIAYAGDVYAPDAVIDDTRMRIALRRPLPPGGAALDILMDYGFEIPEYGADRMGRMEVEQGTIYQVAQWYPRMAVYDDVDGWNTLPYLGQGEFYLEYGTFDLALTVPYDFIVVATGELQNAEEVFTGRQQDRLSEARRSAQTVRIVEADEVGRASSRPQGASTLTWHFHAEQVRDVAWAASQAFLLDAASWNDVLLMTAYPREGVGTNREPGWERATGYLRHAIAHYSETWFPYPYPTATNVAGMVGGMEYPMVIFCDVQDRGQDLFGVTDHEIGHTWFPMLVGSDERRHAWMDEGFTTFINYYANQDMYGDAAVRLARLQPDYIAEQMRSPLAAQPTGTPTDRLHRDAHGFLSYRKPAFGLRLLREHILGPDRFDLAFRTYINRWAHRHPQPADFFRTVEDVAGEDLGWFWRGWFYGAGVFDASVMPVEQGGRTAYAIVQDGGVVLPVDVRFQYADGGEETIRVPAEAYTRGDRVLVMPRRDAPIRSVQTDPDGVLPDVNRENDAWPR